MHTRNTKCLMICRSASFLLVFIALFSVFPLHLLPCFLAGFIMYEIILALTVLVEYLVKAQVARWVSIMFLSILLILLIVVTASKLIGFLLHDCQNLAGFDATASNLLRDAQRTLSPLITRYLPLNIDELKNQLINWLHENLVMQTFSRNAAHTVATMLIGVVLGAMISLQSNGKQKLHTTPLQDALLDRLTVLSEAFHNVIFAQIHVSLCNTLLTGCFLFGILPIFELHLPFSKTIVMLTFFTGLLPIIGNLISNTVIFLIGLSISLEAGLISLTYLIIVHKLEYFINAHIFSGRIHAKTWEILLAMLVFESTFGITGVIAAPIYYAYLKAELRKYDLI
ncbi:AI-2E transporter family protein [Candidatus Erwinia haradaeae]|uniref:AI-2E transporter family protein n=1 Tax=Candidatus Erwinia haradaeae TaxID=1922217 RepID=A0A451DIS7_9GAMM|nr:AI-2E family transporter [Candidatus Erwinia haradaeae]VFP86595.1 AI-2E transporter family protein [Candidatus Erwinia haradaeae]